MWVLGQGDVRNDASGLSMARGGGKGGPRSQHAPRSVLTVCVPSRRRGCIGSRARDDFVNVTRRWHPDEIEKHLRATWDVEV